MNVKKIQNIFHFLEKSSVCNIKTFPVNGFKKKESALEFIKQLLDVKNDYYDISLMKVVERASLKPYYIESIIEILNHFKSVKYGEEGFEIEKPTLFQTELDELPENAEDKLAVRWCFFLKQFQNENDYINLLSIIHVFGICDKNLVRQLKLNEKLLHHLCTYNFLKSEYVSNSESFAFSHDLMEQFFCKYIASFDSYAYKYLKRFNDLTLKRSFPIVYNLCILYENKYNPVSLEEIIYSGSKLNIPYKIFWAYYHNCLIALLNQYELFENKSGWYILCLYSGTHIKKRMGNEYALSFFDQLFSAFTESAFQERYNYSEFADLLFFYGEIKQQLARYHDVIVLYHNNLEQYEKNSTNGNTEQIKGIIAFIYNRLSVAYKHMDGINNEKKKMEYINHSLSLSRQLENKQFLAENCYDKGTYYYCHKKYKKKVLAYWTSCCNLIHKYKIEPMTLHYIEHRIQISLIKKDLSDIQELLQYGRDYLIHGKYNEQSIYFERFFSQAEAVYWLMKKEEYDRVRELLDQAEIANLLLGKNNLTYVNYLRGKLYYNLTDKTRCYQFYKKAYESTQDLIILYKDDFINMLIDDIVIKFRRLEISNNLKPIDFWRKDTHVLRANRILNMSNMEFSQFLENYQAASIITSLDGKENFPYI